jgi:chemotaxis protein histidine kinase CheA
VRIEIRGALQRKIPVVPVLLDATEMPTAAELPDDVKALRRRHAEFVDFRTFDADVQRLIKRLKIGKKIELPSEAAGLQAADNSGGIGAVAKANTFFQWTKPKSPLLAAAIALLVVVGAGAGVYVTSPPRAAGVYVTSPPRMDASAGLADFAKSEEGRRSAEARASEAADTLAKAEKARQQAEATAAAATTAQAKSEAGRLAAEARAKDAEDAAKKSDKARLDAEARASSAAAAQAKAGDLQRTAETARVAAEARANDAAEALRKSENARQDAESKLTEWRKFADAQPSAAPPAPASRKLLTDVGNNSWWVRSGRADCHDTKNPDFRLLKIGDDTILWVNGLRNVATERIISSYENTFQTSTFQGPVVYSRRSDGDIYVEPTGESGFLLKRCP